MASLLTTWPAFISIFIAVVIAMVGVGVQKPNTEDVLATIDTNLYKAFQAVCQIVFSFCMCSKIPIYRCDLTSDSR